MTVSTSLYELILSLFRDPRALAEFRENPDAFLSSCGNFSADDVKDAIELVRDSDDDGHHGRDGGGHHHVHPAPPSNPPEPRDGENEHEVAVRYLNTYVTNNYVDDRDTIVDNSINQHIDTHGGDFDQNIDIDANIATGDGAIAADDIRDSTVTTGHDNVIGDGNAVGEGNIIGHDNVTGDHNITGNDNQVVDGQNNTTSFGEGDANSVDVGDDLNTGDGSSFGLGSGTTTTDNSDHSTNDSFNDSSDHSTHDSGNTTLDVSTEDSYNTEQETHVADSFDDNSTTSHTTHTDVSGSEHIGV